MGILCVGHFQHSGKKKNDKCLGGMSGLGIDRAIIHRSLISFPIKDALLSILDLYTLSQTKLLENHTLHSGIYPYSLYIINMGVPPPPDIYKLTTYDNLAFV